MAICISGLPLAAQLCGVLRPQLFYGQQKFIIDLKNYRTGHFPYPTNLYGYGFP
jgi:hypothetical protein